MGDSLSWEQYVKAAEIFQTFALKFGEVWKIEGDKKIPGSLFLSMASLETGRDSLEAGNINMDQKSNSDSAEDLSKENEEKLNENNIIRCEYHIVYSQSYQVPVIYFNYSKSDGSLLSSKEIQSLRSIKSDDIWSTMSQQEHPVLNVPFYHLHPCNTSKFMNEVCKNKEFNIDNYLISWLSIIGVMLGIPKFSFSTLHKTIRHK